MDKPCTVLLSNFAEKQIAKLPHYIVERLLEWTHTVEELGIREVRKIPGYHDEPLKGRHLGVRSIRLSKSYRAFYEERDEVRVTIILVKEVNHHEY